MATKDPYEALGVAKDASEADIRKAFRRLAKQCHPDLHPGNPEAEERFKEITAAYELLSDAEKRQRYDAGEIDAAGQERPQQRTWRDFAEAGEARGYYHAGGEEAGFADIFAEMFGRGGGRGGARVRMRGQDVAASLAVPFLVAARGGKVRIALPDGRALDVGVPAGVRDRETLRLAGQGGPGLGGGPPGDLYVEVHVEPHAFFTRKDTDVHLELPVALAEAVLGAKVRVPTVEGWVQLAVPPWSNAGTTLRLKGKGIADRRTGERGDQYVKLRIVLPPGRDERLAAVLREAGAGDWDPRAAMEASL